jgi:hypothetical protein
MLALPLRRTLHRQTQEFELPLLQAPPRSKKISAATEENGTRQNKNEEKFLLEPLKKILPSQHPVLKPVSLPDY